MKTAADFRAIARDALKGVWTMAVIIGIIASMLGGGNTGSSGPKVNFDLDDGHFSANVDVAGQTILSTDRHHNNSHSGTGLRGVIAAIGLTLYAMIGALAMGVFFFLLGSVIKIGYAQCNLDLIDRRQLSYSTLFLYFPEWKTLAMTNFLRALYVFLWSLLLIIPGIMKSYSYAMVSYLLSENPQLTPQEALHRSAAMMDGNRMRLFSLHLSFIGWDLLATLTFGIGYLWLTPYKEAANAAFYRELSQTQHFHFGNDDPAWEI